MTGVWVVEWREERGGEPEWTRTRCVEVESEERAVAVAGALVEAQRASVRWYRLR
jgi:hypothetical protein